MYPQSMSINIETINIFPMKFSIFFSRKNLCIFHGQVFVTFTLQSQQSRLLCHMLWSLRGHNVGRVLTDQPGSDEVFARASYEGEALPCL